MSDWKFSLLPEFDSYFLQENLERPTRVQQKVIPLIMEGRSIMAVAQTGTGKTLGYAVPLINQIKVLEKAQGPRTEKASPLMLIMVPTKELGQQVHDVIKNITHHLKVRVRFVSGGMSNEKLATLSRQSFEILVATPNKLKLVADRGLIKLDEVKSLVFDEADTLFEMGFEKDISNIIGRVKLDTQVALFSATLASSIEVFMNNKLKDFKIEKVFFDDAHKVQAKIETFNIFVGQAEKLAMINMFLKRTAEGRGIIFANQKNQVEEIKIYLTTEFPKLKFGILHGDLDASERLKTAKNFKEAKLQILVATDAMARGIDVKDLNWVLNYNLPRNAEFYLHRCGRVGRMGRKGMVYNLVTHRDSALIALINQTIKNQSSLNLDTIAKDIEDIRQKERQKPKKKVQVKRVKITKRTKRK